MWESQSYTRMHKNMLLKQASGISQVSAGWLQKGGQALWGGSQRDQFFLLTARFFLLQFSLEAAPHWPDMFLFEVSLLSPLIS